MTIEAVETEECADFAAIQAEGEMKDNNWAEDEEFVTWVRKAQFIGLTREEWADVVMDVSKDIAHSHWIGSIRHMYSAWSAAKGSSNPVLKRTT